MWWKSVSGVSKLNNVRVTKGGKWIAPLESWSKTCVYEPGRIWRKRWLMAQKSELVTRKDLHSWGSTSAPTLSVNPVIYARRQRARLDEELRFDGYMLLKHPIAAGFVCLRANSRRETVRGEYEWKKHVAFEGLTFICGTMSHFQASHRHLFLCAGGFLPLKRKWTFVCFLVLERRIKAESRCCLFVIIVADLYISEPAARHQFKC